MGTRGRKSEASLAIALHAQTDLTREARPDAPYELTDEEADVWRAVVNNLPATWFSIETFPLLTQYCRHVVRARRIAQAIEAFENPRKGEEKAEDFSFKDYAGMLRMQQAESRHIAMLATKMRIAQQSTIDKEAKKAKVGKRPWQTE